MYLGGELFNVVEPFDVAGLFDVAFVARGRDIFFIYSCYVIYIFYIVDMYLLFLLHKHG